MAKSDTIYTRVEPELKAAVEATLSQLGLSTSEAINMFLSQVVLQKGLPFDVKIPAVDKNEAALTLLLKLKEAEDAVKDGNGWMTQEESRAKLRI